MHDTPREGASPCAGCRLFQRGEIARSTRSSRHPPPRTPRPARSPSSDAAAVARGAQASVQARRDARLRPPLRVLRLTTRVRARDARSRSSAGQGRNPFAGQRRVGMPAVQSAESRHAACRVLSPASVGGKQLHSVCACGAPGAQASGATRRQSGIRRRASRVVIDSSHDAGRGRVRAAPLPASAFGRQCLVTRRRSKRCVASTAASPSRVELFTVSGATLAQSIVGDTTHLVRPDTNGRRAGGRSGRWSSQSGPTAPSMRPRWDASAVADSRKW